MPSALHEAIVHLFQQCPELVLQLLRDVLGLELPPHTRVRTDTNTFSSLKPPQYSTDLFTVFDRDPDDACPAFACIVEVQLAIKAGKHRDWLAYTATATRQLRCDACVLVVSPYADVASWAAEPLPFGLGSTFRPLVIGPAQMPLITDPDRAIASPFLAVLSAVAHGKDPDVETAVAIAAAASQAIVPLPDVDLYSDLILASLGEAARKALEMSLANYEYQYPPYRELFNKGKAEGEAKALVAVLEARGIPLSPEQRDRIFACSDLTILDGWIRKAVHITSADELFG